MTIESKDIITKMLTGNGKYPGDPQASSIWQYLNKMTGKKMFAFFMDENYNDIYVSPYVTSPILLWDRDGLTVAGEDFLKENKK